MLIRDIQRDIIEAYGSLDNPSWGFVEKRYSGNPYRDTVEKLRRIGKIRETTDLNDDCSIALYFPENEWKITVRLSLVGKYACIHDESGVFMTRHDFGEQKSMQDLLRHLDEKQVMLLDDEQLRQRVTVGSEDLLLYAVLFSADELLS